MKKRNKMILFLLILIVFVSGIYFIFFNSDKTEKGIAYLEKQEQLKVEDIQSTLQKKKQAERKQAIENGELDVFSLIDDYVFYGDSRVMGYSAFGLLDSNRVFAASGNSLNNIPDWDSQLQSLNPSYVFISYGVNDMGLNLDGIEGGYDGLAKTQMNHILDIVPNAKIYLCSIIPCSPEALNKNPEWGNVSNYNAKLEKACSAIESCTYVDVTGLADGGNAPIYSGDGIHLTSSFYSTWLNAIVDAMDN
ncbi:SGNH/GDSL hydrolase family protein [Floccifex sp.]|uniref:SGNH/GDSL hydrolase family protein n=1 Tax=Floccifex sp. TaxID=2815810 RepID=UPI003F0D5CB7